LLSFVFARFLHHGAPTMQFFIMNLLDDRLRLLS
jgi:hypothetical protein